MSGGRHGYDGHHGADHVAPMNRPIDRESLPTVDELRAEWLAKVEVADGLDREAKALAVVIADRVAHDLPLPHPDRVEEYRLTADRARRARASAEELHAQLDQARAAAGAAFEDRLVGAMKAAGAVEVTPS